ncbi:MAG: glycerol-3-phosphate dehydrogenase/oxidase [Planctomycetota bacterium]
MEWRSQALRALRDRKEVPVLILGGGVNGAGLFRELAFQGVECLLVDRSDFAAGATSKSSRMIHGGLRYLENAEFRLVREALRERNLLLETARHYVSPLETTIPLFSWFAGAIRSPLVFLGLPVAPGERGALVVKLGLAFYDLFSRPGRRMPKHRMRSRAESLRRIPDLNPAIVGTATYWDSRITQAERLCVELVQDALRASPRSAALNYVRLEGLDGPDAVLRDEPTGEAFRVRPRVVVNATGAWVDLANRSLGVETRYMGGTKGSHLVVRNERLVRALGDRMVYYQHRDGRVCIAFGFFGKAILGSTDIPVADPDAASCDEAEVAYMLETLRRVFPAIEVSRSDIVYKFCGVRPLPATGDAIPGRITRDHSIRPSEPEGSRPFPILSLVGGKWTTFRALAEQAADLVLARLGTRRRFSTSRLEIGGARGCPRTEEERGSWIARVARERGASPERVATLLARYGTGAESYLASLEGSPEHPLRTLPEYAAEEIRRIAERDFVVHLADLVCRRTLIALLGEARSDALEEIAGIAGERLGWDADRRAREVETAAREVSGS